MNEQRPSSRRWTVALSVAVLALLVGSVVVLLLLNRAGPAASTPTPIASHSIPASSLGTADTASSPSPTSAGETTPPTDAGAVAWTAAATYGEAGTTHLAGDVGAWDRGFVAVGTRYAGEQWNVFGPPPAREGRVWTSPDGTAWTDATPDETFAGVELADLLVTSDGTLLVFGTVYEQEVAGPLTHSVVWESSDAATWSEVGLEGIPVEAQIGRVESGGRGHVAVVATDTALALHHSPDGRTWTQTLAGVTDVGAGDEGFVAVVVDPQGGDGQLIASSDGLEWVEGETLAAERVSGTLVAGRGPDWLRSDYAFGEGGPGAATILGSANGLEWEVRGEVAMAIRALGCPEFPYRLHAVGEFALLSTGLSGCSEGQVSLPGAAYGSNDGAAWEVLPFGDHAAVAGGAVIDNRHVVVTDRGTNRGPDPEPGTVTMWLGTAE